MEWTEPFGDKPNVTWVGKVASIGACIVIHTQQPCIKCVEVDSASELPGLRRVE